ncbi:hypothetical protein B7486_01915 [cyanobacterium TDX16]|nr:hypothetical protein B7486_01915 [cyanobacterium TDX16]
MSPSRCDLASYSLSYPQVRPVSGRFLSWLQRAAAVASALGARAVGGSCALFSSKKEQGRKSLIFLNRKRHELTGDRHDRSLNRQKTLALLSLVCQCVVCLQTNLEVENDGSATDCGDAG